MKATRLCGFDVNGFRDISARNWDLENIEELNYDDEYISNGGLWGSVVCVGEGPEKSWVGGRQAELAPHGRGEGWGNIGDDTRRILIRDLLEGLNKDHIALGEAYKGLSESARVNVAAIEENGSDQEKSQERILESLSAVRISNSLLVWRSVCAALYRIKETEIPEQSMIGVISHASEGFSLQKLRIFKEDGHSGPVFAPERRNVATLVTSELGYKSLNSKARKAILGDPHNSRTTHRIHSQLIGKLALGEQTSQELLRQFNGDWEVIEPPQPLDLEYTSLHYSDFDLLSECDQVIFESLTVGSTRRIAMNACQVATRQEIIDLPIDAIARGALEAARRVAKGDPVYFDFLPKISTIVFTGEKAENFDLIKDSERLKAGQLYRSPEPAQLALPAQQEAISVYIRKEAEEFPRKAVVSLGKPLAQDTPVLLNVEQKPASGRARILLNAKKFRRNFKIEWDDAEEINEDWEQLIVAIQDEFNPSIPNRLVLENSINTWNVGKSKLAELLELNVEKTRVDWASLSKKMSTSLLDKEMTPLPKEETSPPRKLYCISSDGLVPDGVRLEHLEMLDKLNEKALIETHERITGKRKGDNNDALKFLTWQFRRCPEEIADIFLHYIETRDGRNKYPPLVNHHGSWVLIYQGFSRIVSDQIREERVLKAILSTNPCLWVWRIETACLAILLSRSKTMPCVVDETQLKIMATRVKYEFNESIGSEYTKFIYAPFLLAGLLRFRSKKPRSLVLGHDLLAKELLAAVEKVLEDFNRKDKRSMKFENAVKRYKKIVEDLALELRGKGKNPNILVDISKNL